MQRTSALRAINLESAEGCRSVSIDLQSKKDCRDWFVATLSTGDYNSCRQLAQLAAEVIGYEPEVVGGSGQPAGVFVRDWDTGKQAAMEFAAGIQFVEGIRRALNYSKSAAEPAGA